MADTLQISHYYIRKAPTQKAQWSAITLEPPASYRVGPASYRVGPPPAT